MLDVIGENMGVIFILLIIMWGAQFAMTYFQMRRFYGRLKVIRKAGLTAVGMGGGQYKGRAYGVLTIDDDDRVIHAERMSGWTNFSGLRPVPEMEGMPLANVLNESIELPVKSAKLQEAFRNAARDLDKARKGDVPETLTEALGATE